MIYQPGADIPTVRWYTNYALSFRTSSCSILTRLEAKVHKKEGYIVQEYVQVQLHHFPMFRGDINNIRTHHPDDACFKHVFSLKKKGNPFQGQPISWGKEFPNKHRDKTPPTRQRNRFDTSLLPFKVPDKDVKSPRRHSSASCWDVYKWGCLIEKSHL